MSNDKIIIGQHVKQIKKERSRELRKEMTPEEKVLWHYLRGSSLDFKFRRQQVIDGFIVDFYCHSVGLIIEVDGAVHLNRNQKSYDEERDRILQSRGLDILRISNEDINCNLYNTIARINKICISLREVRKER